SECRSHFGAWRSSQRIRHLADGPSTRGERVDFDDEVALANAAHFRRRVRIDGRDLDDMRLRIFLDRHSESAVASTGSAIELFEVLWSQQLAVRIIELSDESSCRLFI